MTVLSTMSYFQLFISPCIRNVYVSPTKNCLHDNKFLLLYIYLLTSRSLSPLSCFVSLPLSCAAPSTSLVLSLYLSLYSFTLSLSLSCSVSLFFFCSVFLCLSFSQLFHPPPLQPLALVRPLLCLWMFLNFCR